MAGFSSSDDMPQIKGRRVGAAEAFRRGAAVLKDRLDLLDSNGWIRFRRAERSEWVMEVMGYRGQGLGSIIIVIKDNGTVEEGGAF